MDAVYFWIVGLGVPLSLLAIAMLAALFAREGYPELDWKPTRSPKREAELELCEIDQMLDALNRYRRLHGASERSLDEVIAARGSGGVVS